MQCRETSLLELWLTCGRFGFEERHRGWHPGKQGYTNVKQSRFIDDAGRRAWVRAPDRLGGANCLRPLLDESGQEADLSTLG